MNCYEWIVPSQMISTVNGLNLEEPTNQLLACINLRSLFTKNHHRVRWASETPSSTFINFKCDIHWHPTLNFKIRQNTSKKLLHRPASNLANTALPSCLVFGWFAADAVKRPSLLHKLQVLKSVIPVVTSHVTIATTRGTRRSRRVRSSRSCLNNRGRKGKDIY